jgi:hypothetical protein
METEVAPAVLHVSTADWPAETAVGLAVRVAVGSEAATLTVTLLFADPALLMAVTV